ncbi:lipoprotein LpqH [Mycobacterium shinjukuense]|uniref:Lipoprotein n=1 Tax=Mycobacterium shinjukuense TaxID=398694 RepID=A0A7I7MRE6_9MYCO|nr:lipoprotein LpqH [Mycobacterium shinjukuense]MCV6987310.1 lipoprotein LpqH [Mycobacterium shinjukuense]ORB72030.1 hypothetical protein BST45_01170 [Mycobacterium shinjukuense]BBX74785.1 lipoprotein [Mycobacterium shinjukuense]
MKRELLTAAGAATCVAVLAGCSSDDEAASPSPGAPKSSVATGAATPSSATPAAPGETRVIIGGRAQNVGGPVVCSTNDGKFSIAIGDLLTGVIVGLEPDASAVRSAGLGTVDGVVLSFTEGAPGNSATATKNGNSYRITGTATGVDSAGQQVSKTFEVDATCP